MLLCNHSSWIEVFYALYDHLPSFVARIGTKHIPMVGKFSDYLNSIYVDRTSAGSRSNTSDAIIAHQKRYVEGKEKTQVLIYPEG